MGIKVAIKGKKLIMELKIIMWKKRHSMKLYLSFLLYWDITHSVQYKTATLQNRNGISYRKFTRTKVKNKLRLLNNLLKTRYKTEINMADHVCRIASQFTQLAAIAFQ